MADLFELFRLSLLPREQADLLTGNLTREEYLRKVFNETHTYERYGITYHYVPAEQTSDEAVLGRLGRKTIIEENLSPDKGLEESTHEGWKASVLVLDPKHHQDGQKLAIESDKQVGRPSILIASLAKAINDANPHAPYVIEAAPIIDAETFWDFESANKGNITSLSFEFITPNMFGGVDEISEELRNMRQYEHANRVKTTITNPDGLETETGRIKSSVEYAAKGGGKILAHAKGNKRYNSTGKSKSVTIADDGEEQEHLLIRAARKITEILGR